jgi:very-short-patch-repair endonuclease
MIKRSRDLRKDAPIPEHILWSTLRNRRLGGLKFRRQQGIGPSIVDYICFEKRLIVELDGMSHVGRAEADERRQDRLERDGFTVFRVTNDGVLLHHEATLTGIARAAGLDW